MVMSTFRVKTGQSSIYEVRFSKHTSNPTKVGIAPGAGESEMTPFYCGSC
jgi:hypothetical protein